MAITTTSIGAEVLKDPRYEEQIRVLNETPKVWRINYFDGREVYKVAILAETEDDAMRLFYLLVGDRADQVQIEYTESFGYVEFICPNLEKYYRAKLPIEVKDKFYLGKKQAQDTVDKKVAAENKMMLKKREQANAQEISHTKDLLEQNIRLLNKVMTLEGKK